MSLLELFKEHKNRHWVFMAPGGNQGDQMIYLGADKLADQAGIQHTSVLYKKRRDTRVHILPEDTMIYLQGGGGFNRWWNWTPWLLKMIREANPYNHIVIGPTTVDNNKPYLDHVLNLDDNMTFFTREKTSFKIMQEYSHHIRIDHDTALCLRHGDGYLMRLVGELEPRNDVSLLVLRSDDERGTIPESINRGDFDIVEDPCRHGQWAQDHMHAKRIVANRSHSAIMGAILGKDTSIFAGAYHKNKSIYEYSLKEMGVHWLE